MNYDINVQKKYENKTINEKNTRKSSLKEMVKGKKYLIITFSTLFASFPDILINGLMLYCYKFS